MEGREGNKERRKEKGIARVICRRKGGKKRKNYGNKKWIRGKKNMEAGNERRKKKGSISSVEEKSEYNDFEGSSRIEMARCNKSNENMSKFEMSCNAV